LYLGEKFQHSTQINAFGAEKFAEIGRGAEDQRVTVNCQSLDEAQLTILIIKPCNRRRLAATLGLI
jgi:hypothetical protein